MKMEGCMLAVLCKDFVNVTKTGDEQEAVKRYDLEAVLGVPSLLSYTRQSTVVPR